MDKDRIKAARTAAAEQHARTLGAASACAMSKSGKSFPAGKFWEGKTAALGELLHSGDRDATRLYSVWNERHIPGNEREVAAYRAGGLEALREFMPE